MVIHNPEMWDMSRWDWSPLNDHCFDAKRMRGIMDMDGYMPHETGKNLGLETKYFPHTSLTNGQKINFERLLRSGQWRIIVIWGVPGDPKYMQVYYEDGTCTVKKKTNLEELQAEVRAWYQEQENNKPPRLPKRDLEYWEERNKRIRR